MDIIGMIALGAGIALFMWYMNKESKKMKEQQEKMEEEQRRERERQEAEHKRMMENSARLIAMTEMLNQAKAVGDDFTVESIQRNIYHGELPTESYGQWSSMYDNLMIVKIAGINYRGNLSAYVGKFKGVLKPEPKNDYDPNAIMIKCEDGKHLGYVPEDETEDVRAFIGADGVDFLPYRIEGEIEECEDFDDDDERKFFVGRVYVVRKKE